MLENQSPRGDLKDRQRRFFDSLGIKLCLLGILALLLMIPLAMIDGLLGEREFRKRTAVSEIGAQWGASQSLWGPILQVPVTMDTSYTETVVENGRNTKRYAKREGRSSLYVLPDGYDLKGTMNPEIRYRGIFRAPVYKSSLRFQGVWKRPDTLEIGGGKMTVDWSRARILMRVTDGRAIANLDGSVGEERIEAEPAASQLSDGEWISFPFDWKDGLDTIDFAFDLDLRGSESLGFLPLGKNGQVSLSSSWRDPSFSGSFLPSERSVSPDGFSALWEFGEFGRGVPSHWLQGHLQEQATVLGRSACWVSLEDPVDGYRLTDRSLKYGILFIGLGFTVFFLFEVLCGLRLHPMHYLLAGAAQALFFLLTLSLSEFVSFFLAYGIAAVASIGLIAFYALPLLKSRKRVWAVTGCLAGLYGSLWAILKQQDFALLTGSAALFATLAVFMFLTRKLDWGDLGSHRGSEDSISREGSA